MAKIVTIWGQASERDDLRCRDYVELLERRNRLAGGPGGGAEPPPAPAPALLRLARAGRLAFTEESAAWAVHYVPSRQAVESLSQPEAAGAFPKSLQKKHLGAVRKSAGALFRFPAEEGDGALEVFITDWSPCPAACAVAVHRDHPFVASPDRAAGSPLPPEPAAAFSGRYVRHPLTGDLLPVWVAGWVRPDFGTGAVLVNPAHDATDLAFGRRVGLPIRFALVPAADDGSPETWPQPPVVRTGRAVRTGPYDGLEAPEAMERYFQVLAERGLARRHTDLAAGSRQVARLLPEVAGELAWEPAGRRLVAPEEAGTGASRVRIEEAELLAAAVTADPGDTLVCPAAEQKEALLYFRLLAYDLQGQPPRPEEVVTVQKVQETAVEAEPRVLRLGALLGAAPDQVVTLKQQVVEQVQRFLRVHGELTGELAQAGVGPEAPATPKALQGVKAALAAGDPSGAFNLLSKVQKELAGLPRRELTASALAPGYCAAAWVLADLEAPPGLDLAAAWAGLEG